MDLANGVGYAIEIAMTNDTGWPSVALEHGGVRLGGQEVICEDDSIKATVELAKHVDVPIVVAGLNADYESEAYDRQNLELPGRTNELIQRVAKANPNTVSFP